MVDNDARYIAPEMLRGERYDRRVDWWSLGCTVYEVGPPSDGVSRDRIRPPNHDARVTGQIGRIIVSSTR
jgi:serine/threonine protein kinase